MYGVIISNTGISRPNMFGKFSEDFAYVGAGYIRFYMDIDL